MSFLENKYECAWFIPWSKPCLPYSKSGFMAHFESMFCIISRLALCLYKVENQNKTFFVGGVAQPKLDLLTRIFAERLTFTISQTLKWLFYKDNQASFENCCRNKRSLFQESETCISDIRSWYLKKDKIKIWIVGIFKFEHIKLGFKL